MIGSTLPAARSASALTAATAWLRASSRCGLPSLMPFALAAASADFVRPRSMRALSGRARLRDARQRDRLPVLARRRRRGRGAPLGRIQNGHRARDDRAWRLRPDSAACAPWRAPPPVEAGGPARRSPCQFQSRQTRRQSRSSHPQRTHVGTTGRRVGRVPTNLPTIRSDASGFPRTPLDHTI